MVLMRGDGRLIEVRSEHFPEVNSHGFPRDKAENIRLEALSRLIEYAAAHGAKVFVFERLVMRRRKKTGSKRGGEFKTVKASYSSTIAELINKDLGMDIETVSKDLLP